MSSIFGSPSKSSSSTQSIQNSESQGSSDSSSQSYNRSYDGILQALAPQLFSGTGASSGLASLLGLGGDPAAQQQAFNTWKDSTGYQFGLDQGSQAITQNNAAKGLLNSGDTLKALDTYGQNYANTQFQNYLNPLQALIGSGNQAASTIGNTGQISNSNSTSNSSSTSSGNSVGLTDSRGASSGIMGGLGQLAAGFATGGGSTLMSSLTAGGGK